MVKGKPHISLLSETMLSQIYKWLNTASHFALARTCKAVQSGLYHRASWPCLFLTARGSTENFVELVNARRLRPLMLRLRASIEINTDASRSALRSLTSLLSLRATQLRPQALACLRGFPLLELELMTLRVEEARQLAALELPSLVSLTVLHTLDHDAAQFLPHLVGLKHLHLGQVYSPVSHACVWLRYQSQAPTSLILLRVVALRCAGREQLDAAAHRPVRLADVAVRPARGRQRGGRRTPQGALAAHGPHGQSCLRLVANACILRRFRRLCCHRCAASVDWLASCLGHEAIPLLCVCALR